MGVYESGGCRDTWIVLSCIIGYMCGVVYINASIKGKLELNLLKVRQRFDVENTSNLEVYIFIGGKY